jgi:formylglycine-generating enzyme required for sulfatase activity
MVAGAAQPVRNSGAAPSTITFQLCYLVVNEIQCGAEFTLVRSVTRERSRRLIEQRKCKNSWATAMLISALYVLHGLALGPLNAVAQVASGVPTIEELEKKLEQEKAGKSKSAAPVKPAEPLKPAEPPGASKPSVVAEIESHMVAIRAGTFRMGSESNASDEQPVHSVNLGAFRLSTYDVTFDQYDAFAVATGRSLGLAGPGGRGNRPVVNVNWDEAQAFIAWLNQFGKKFRLPSEAEWEYAARAGTKTSFFWGDQFKVGRLNNSHESTTPVGSFPPNGWGLYDMNGNVWQWTQDCYHANYVGAPTDGSAWQSSAGCSRVIRGGSWRNNAPLFRVSKRNSNGPASRADNVGFRLAQDL